MTSGQSQNGNGSATSVAHRDDEFWEYQPLEPDRLCARAKFYAERAGASADSIGVPRDLRRLQVKAFSLVGDTALCQTALLSG